MEKFSYEANGYNRSEVNNFIEEVIKETEGIISRVKSQSVEIERLKKDLEHYKAIEDSLNNTIKKAEENASEVKRLAKEEAELIISDAKSNASHIVNDALVRAKKIEEEKDLAIRNMEIFKKKLKLIMQQQMAVVEEIEVLELEG